MRYAGSLPSHDPHCTTCGAARREVHSAHPHTRAPPVHRVEGVRSTFARYGLLDDAVHFLKGFFHDTLPRAIERGVSAWQVLRALGPRLHPVRARRRN